MPFTKAHDDVLCVIYTDAKLVKISSVTRISKYDYALLVYIDTGTSNMLTNFSKTLSKTIRNRALNNFAELVRQAISVTYNPYSVYDLIKLVIQLEDRETGTVLKIATCE